MLAIALIVGVSGAFASKAANSGKVDDPKYNWTDARPGHSMNLSNKTVAQAQNSYGCSGAFNLCATGSPVPGSSGPIIELFIN